MASARRNAATGAALRARLFSLCPLRRTCREGEGDQVKGEEKQRTDDCERTLAATSKEVIPVYPKERGLGAWGKAT